MREIKFRAWNDIDKTMCDNGVVLHRLSALTKIKSYHVMQFIGCLDSMGNELFEGDIIEDVTGRAYFVEYNQEWAAFVFHRVGKQILRSVDDLRGVVVVGNIYQNPELVKP